MTITQAATQAYHQLATRKPFALQRGRMFLIDLDGNVQIVGTYADPDVGFTDVIERHETFGEFRYFGMEWTGMARPVDVNGDEQGEDERVYLVAVVDRNLDVGVYSLFESRPDDPLIEDGPEGRLAEQMKSVMACLVMLRLTAG